MRRCITRWTSSSSSTTKYLPRRRTASIRRPRTASATSAGAAGSHQRGSSTSSDSSTRPSMRGASWRLIVSTSGSSGISPAGGPCRSPQRARTAGKIARVEPLEVRRGHASSNTYSARALVDVQASRPQPRRWRAPGRPAARRRALRPPVCCARAHPKDAAALLGGALRGVAGRPPARAGCAAAARPGDRRSPRGTPSPMKPGTPRARPLCARPRCPAAGASCRRPGSAACLVVLDGLEIEVRRLRALAPHAASEAATSTATARIGRRGTRLRSSRAAVMRAVTARWPAGAPGSTRP